MHPAPGPSTTPTTHPVFVIDDLTKTRSHLLYECRKVKKNGKIKETWSIDGNILIRDKASRVSQINNIRDLEKQAVWHLTHTYTIKDHMHEVYRCRYNSLI